MIPTRLRNHQLGRVRLPNRLRSPAAETDRKMCWHYWPPTNIREKCEDFGRFAPGRWHICQIAQIDFAMEDAMDATLSSGFVVRGLCLDPILANWNCGLWGSVPSKRKILTHWIHIFPGEADK